MFTSESMIKIDQGQINTHTTIPKTLSKTIFTHYHILSLNNILGTTRIRSLTLITTL